MVDDDRRKFEIPWAILLPVIAAVAGIIAQYKPLVSERPAAPGEKAVEVVAEQDVDARLWQDPLAVAQKKKAELDAEKLKTGVPPGRTQLHEIKALKDKVHSSVDASAPDGRILLLAVMLNSGPYIEQGESRLRARQAVLEGLSESGFEPQDSEHIGFINWTQDTGEDKETLIPWEECKVVDDPDRVYPRGTKGAFVLWLPSVSFAQYPLESLADLISRLVGEIHDHVDVKLIGPATSTGLRNMVKELPGPVRPSRYDSLDGLDIISPRATVWDFLLSEGGHVQQIIQGYVAHPKRGGIRFHRTIADDDRVLIRLIKELKLRNIDVFHEKEKKDKIVLLTEWDSPYGRSLAKTFAALVFKKASKKSHSVIEGQWPEWILSYRYLRGIDGRLPGEQVKPAGTEDKQKARERCSPSP